MCKQIILFAILCLTLPTKGFTQNIHTDTTFLQSSLKQAYKIYSKTVAYQSHLYNGSEYLGYNARIKGHQYFESKEWEDGSLYYDEVFYSHIPLLYEVANDEVILKHHNGFSKIRLISDKIKSFTLRDHTFVRLEKDTSNTSVIETGFYDKLYDGGVKVFAKRTKYIQDNVTQQGLDSEFLIKDSYYLFINDRYYPVKSKKSVLKVFKDKKKPLLKHLRENKIRFKKNNEQAIIKSAQFYDAL